MVAGCVEFIVESEAVPSVLRQGIVVPVYNGGGKDPLKVDSFRGVTLTSTLAKVLEFLIVERRQLLLLEAGLPHINQSAYQRGMHILCRGNLSNPSDHSTVHKWWQQGVYVPV